MSHRLVEQDLVEEALSLGGERVTLSVPQRGDKKRLIDRILATAREALGRRLAESASQRQLLDGVAAAFGIDGPLNRIEVYDNSHIQGTNAVGAMIVAGPEGLMKSAYRKFNIRGGEALEPEALALDSPPAATAQDEESPGPGGISPDPEPGGMPGSKDRAAVPPAPLTPGDDYGMMREVLMRRLARALKEDPERARGAWPDLILVDGGAGQLSVAMDVLGELGITDVGVAAIAKGPDRNAGRERFFVPGKPPFSLDPRDPILYFMQRLRDEAHRFAIGTHRARRAADITRSAL